MSRLALRLLPVFAIWAAAATVLAFATRRVVDWFVMTDELLYERVGFSMARSGSPLPTLHGRRIPFANDLYPVFVSLVAGDELVPDFLRRMHTWNAIAITSAAVPAFLIARRAFGSTLGAYAVSALTVVLPWLVLSSFLLTDAVAYPAFLWAVFAIQRAIDRPTATGDVLALCGIALATIARTQFFVLAAVAVLAALAAEATPRRAFERHRVLAAATAVGVVVVAALAIVGKAHVLLGSYAATAQGKPLSTQLPQTAVEHAAVLALGLGILPFLLGCAWLGARALRRDASGLVLLTATVLLIVEVASFDLRFGGGLTHDRYLYDAAPLVLAGFVGVLLDRTLARWSLLPPLAVVLVGFSTMDLPVFAKLNVDDITAILDDYLLRSGGSVTGARFTLIGATLLLLVIFVLARLVLPLPVVAIGLTIVTLGALTAETAYAFERLFRVDGTSGRPITLQQGGVFDWIDRTLGPNADVTMIPYAQLRGDYWATAAYWWDLEFWNRSVVRDAYIDDTYAEIQSTFPKTTLAFDPSTGRANISPTRYAAQSEAETRFRLRGPVASLTRSVLLIDAGKAWQADWLTLGLDDDGFTQPGRAGTLRIFSAPGQRRPEFRYVTLQLQAPNVPLSATLSSNAGHWSLRVLGDTDANLGATVCVPPHGYADILIHPHGSTQVYGDYGTRAGLAQTRVRGILVSRIALADETGPTCKDATKS